MCWLWNIIKFSFVFKQSNTWFSSWLHKFCRVRRLNKAALRCLTYKRIVVIHWFWHRLISLVHFIWCVPGEIKSITFICYHVIISDMSHVAGFTVIDASQYSHTCQIDLLLTENLFDLLICQLDSSWGRDQFWMIDHYVFLDFLWIHR